MVWFESLETSSANQKSFSSYEVISHSLNICSIWTLSLACSNPQIAPMVQVQAVSSKWWLIAEVATSKPAHVDRKGSTWFPPFRLGSEQSAYNRDRNISAWLRGVEGSWHRIWGTSRDEDCSWPWFHTRSAICADKGACFVCLTCMCWSAQGPQCGGPQWHYKHIQQCKRDKTGRLPVGSPLGVDKGSSCFLQICVCEPCHNKAGSHCPLSSSSVKTPDRWRLLGILCQILPASSEAQQHEWKNWHFTAGAQSP